MKTLTELFYPEEFIDRHIGSNQTQQTEMLAVLGVDSLDELLKQTIPHDIFIEDYLALPDAISEADALARLRQMADDIQVNKSFIGLGYYPTRLPNVIVRNVLENPGWYTAYTPYQAEIAQGRLEALLNFQQMIIDLTGLEIANASLLDEATAAAEAMAMAHRVAFVKSNKFFVDQRVLPQTLDVLKTRAAYLGIELVIGDPQHIDDQDYFAALFQYPGEAGDVVDLTPIISQLKARKTISIIAADLMSLVLLKSPAEMGADIALGSSQRFGIPMGFGGPHAAYFAFRDEMKRSAPGRIIGVTVDASGNPALRMALQTREQHIRREKATSNICTSQALLANLAGMYAVYHGPEGIRRIACRIHRLAVLFARAIEQQGGKLCYQQFFDTVQVDVGSQCESIYQAALTAGYNLRKVSHTVLGVAFHEQASAEDLVALITLFTGKVMDLAVLESQSDKYYLSETLWRKSPILTHPVFNRYHTELEMMRYLKRLENKDLAMNHSMISLGSCTMKLNASSEMLPISWPEFAEPHPFAPKEQVKGYLAMLDSLAQQLKTITGFDAISLQPNSGASGEYAGMLTIRRYLDSSGHQQRNICLIPSSAHGTNPATAKMMGMDIVIVSCDQHGNVDVADLRHKAQQHADKLAALMITYPSTHGVYEEKIREICQIIHQYGGQVYMDGANMNGQVALMQPAKIGADVLHMNLHKTFAIPHGGGGPGMGPIAMTAHLAPFMPGHVFSESHVGAVSAAPFGSASILPITWMYITMMGRQGLRKATEFALLNANYMATRLAEHYPILYTGLKGRVAHECIVDLRPLKASSGITEVDVAKRLMDYGFHAPTMSFPVAGTLMIEPTESESKAELDRFIAALINIRQEIDNVEQGVWPAEDNPLKNAPHTQADLVGPWQHAYSRQEAVFPLPFVAENKFWPSVKRANDVYGDRNLVCSCPPISDYL